jgi:hydrogenase maturation protease
MSEERILVMGVGNPLMRDEGVGPRVVELLRAAYEFPDNVEVVDAGTMGFMILDVLRGFDRLIIVDALQGTDEPAGTVMLLTPDDFAPNQVMHSLHDTRLIDVLQAAELIDIRPETVAVGVQIESIQEWVLELSPAVEAALPTAAAVVLEQLHELGVVPAPRLDTDPDVHASIIGALRSYEPMPAQRIESAEESSDS